MPRRQLEFKRSEPNVTFQILYVLTLVTLTNPFCCIKQRCCIKSPSMSVSGIGRMFFILCFCDMHRVATMASCWLVQLFSLDPLFLIFRDVMFQGWRLTVSSLSVDGNVETFFIIAISFVSLICTGWQRWQVVGQDPLGHP